MNTIWFDMDGTIYDLYKITGWLGRLIAQDVTVYGEDKPRHGHERINAAIEALQNLGWRVGILTWGGKGLDWNDEFFIATSETKFEWVCKYFPALADGCFACIPYGYSKADFLIEMEQDGNLNILVDDNLSVRRDWRAHGANFKTINASRSFVRELEGLAG